MKISENVYILELPNNGSTLNPVLVWDNNELIIIDVGFPGQFELIKAEMKKYGFYPDKITKVLFTHQDIDHIGCFNDIKKENAKVQSYCHVDEAKYIDGTEIPIKIQQQLLKYSHMTEEEKAFINNLKSAFENGQIRLDGLLNHNDVLPFAGGMRILHTPGHTPGHICIYLEKDKILIAGDALNKKYGVLTGPNPGYTQDMTQACNSLKQLYEMDIQAIVCYHGGIVTDHIKDSLTHLKEYNT